MKPTLYLLDGLGLIYRAYYALMKARMVSKSGEPTGAIYGFMIQVFRLIELRKPTYAVVAFDSKEKTFRHDIYPAYKANRQAPDEDLIAQLEKIKALLSAYKFPYISLPNFEADDIIGTLAQQYKEICDVFIFSVDKDFAQLVDDAVSILRVDKRNEFAVLDRAGVEDVYGVEPSQFVDYLALVGDSSDNVPGIKGIGPKTASKLIQSHGSVDGIYKSLENQPSRIQKAFFEGKDTVSIAQRLIAIKCDVSLTESLEDLKLGEPDKEELTTMLEELNMKTFLNKIKQAGDSKTAPEDTASLSKAKNKYQNSVATIQTMPKIYELCSILNKQSVIAFDTETTSLNVMHAELVSISFAYNSTSSYVVYMPSLEKEETLKLLKTVFENESVSKVAQNIKYDVGVLAHHGISVKGEWIDTMIASYVLNPDEKHNMDDMASRLLGIETIKYRDLVGTGKNQISICDVPIESLADYSGQDAVVTFALYEKLIARITENKKLKHLYKDLEMPLIQVLLEMEATGIAIDRHALKELSNLFTERTENLKKEICQFAGETFNIDSTKQLGSILFEKLGIPPVKKTKTGYSTDSQVLESLEKNYPIVHLVVEYRRLKKLLNTYIDVLPLLVEKKTGRVHTSFNQSVASTGRLSSSNPNLQNIPIRTEQGRMIRKAFIPRDSSRVLVSADYSQIELRIASELSSDDYMLDAFLRKEDIHAATARLLFGAKEITPDMRAQAKAINFGVLYGMTAHSLSRQMGLPLFEARAIVKDYKLKYQKLFMFMQETLKNVREKGYVETLMGRRRYIKDINSKNFSIRHAAERMAINTPVQGTAADIIKRAMIQIDKRLKKEQMDSKMVLQVHDELVFDALKTEVEPLSALVCDEMVEAGLYVGIKKTPIIVDIKNGKNWLDAH